MFIPYGTRYTSTLLAQIPMSVQCEECGYEYVYTMTRTAQGEGSSLLFLDNAGAQDRASNEARNELLYKLQTHCDPVPCPACGRYQEHMIPRARWHRRRWMLTAGLYALPLSIIVGLVGYLTFAIGYSTEANGATMVGGVMLALAAIGLGCAIALPLNKFLSSRHYDPNREDVEARKQLGQKRALSREEYEKRNQEWQGR